MAKLMKFDIVKPEIPKDWNYEESIIYLKPKIYNWKKETIEIAKELYKAKNILSAPGRRTDLLPSDSRLPTFKEYCSKIDIPERTAFRWIVMAFGPQRLPSPPLPKLESQVIYADPPWSFSNTGFDQSAAQKYPTLTIEEICNYTDKNGKTIRQLANEKQSVLFLWVPAALLPEGLEVVKAWRFLYKSQMIWKKDKSPGMGWWVNSKHELLFIASRGENLHPTIKYDSVFEAPVTQHSRKPKKIYEMIEKMYTGPYIELFARPTEERSNWTYWGNEIE